MGVPPYCKSRAGGVFRLQRFSERVAPDRVRYVLRATPVRRDPQANGVEVARELDAEGVRDSIRLGQVIATPEDTYEQLWQQLRLDLDVG